MAAAAQRRVEGLRAAIDPVACADASSTTSTTQIRLSTARPPPVHRPSTARPPPVHRPSTARLPSVHRPSTARPPSVHRSPFIAAPPRFCPVHRPAQSLVPIDVARCLFSNLFSNALYLSTYEYVFEFSMISSLVFLISFILHHPTLSPRQPTTHPPAVHITHSAITDLPPVHHKPTSTPLTPCIHYRRISCLWRVDSAMLGWAMS